MVWIRVIRDVEVFQAALHHREIHGLRRAVQAGRQNQQVFGHLFKNRQGDASRQFEFEVDVEQIGGIPHERHVLEGEPAK